jgi:glucokinase
VQAAIEGLIARHGVEPAEVMAVGLGTPGPIDVARGLILDSPNLPGWLNFPLRDRLARLCGKPIGFANDANAAASGEYWVGGGRGHNSMIMLTLGTGVGGGIIYEGTLIEGVNSFGSECGHIVIDQSPDARLCVWGGGRGQLEAYASASAVVQRTEERLQAGEGSSLSARIGGGESLTALMIAEEAAAGDSLSLQVVLETARHLAVGIVTLVHTIDPGIVILGGAMNFGGPTSELGRRFLQEVRDEFRRRAFEVVADGTVIEYAVLGADAGYIGAAGIARQAVQRAQR